MPDEEGKIPDWMKERAGKIEGAGGQRKYELSKEAEEALKHISKIKPKTWKVMGDTINTFVDFIDEGAFGGLQDIGDDFKETLTLKVEEALAPLSNEIDQALSDALDPIMPEIQAFMAELGNQFSLGFGYIIALFTGDLDNWMTEQTVKFQKGIDGWDDDWKAFHLEVQKWRQGWEDDWEDFIEAFTEGAKLLGLGWEGFWSDIGAGWSGFWSDLGWK